MQFLLAFVAIVMLISACSSDPERLLPYTLDIDEESFGPIRAGMEFSAPKLNARLPGFDVERFSMFADGRARPLLRVRYHGRDVFVVEPDETGRSIGAVWTADPALTHRRAHIGMTFAEQFERFDPNVCRIDAGARSDETVCRAPGSSHVEYVFEHTPSSGPGTSEAAQTRRLSRIVWKP